MKTLTKLFTLLLFVVFSTKSEAQVVADVTTTVVQHDVTNTISIDHSPNGQDTVVAVDGYNGDGYAAVYYNTCAGHNFGDPIATYTLHKGTTGATGVVISQQAATISNNSNSYFFFKSTIIGNTPRYVLQKNGNEIMYFDGLGIAQLKVFNGYLFMFLIGTTDYFYKIDENTNQIIFSVPVADGDIGEMLLMPNGNIAGKVRPGNTGEGNLYEFDANTGVELGLIRSGNPYGREKFGDNGDLEVYDHDAQKFFVYSQNSGWASIIKQTDLPSATENLFRMSPKDWEFKNGEFHAIQANYFIILSDNLVHGNLEKRLLDLTGLKTMWFNNDDTYSIITADSNHRIHLLKVSNAPLNTSLIPTVHIGGDVVDGRNGQKYDNGWQNVDPHILTLVMNDANMPNIGDTPDANWINLPSGYTYGGAFPVRDDSGTLVYDALYYNTSTGNKTFVRVFIKPASEVLGVQENTLTDFKVWPNPAREYINFSAGKDISQVKIFDINGRCVLQQNAIGNQGVFVRDLSPGIYLVRVQAGKQTGSRKWVKW